MAMNDSVELLRLIRLRGSIPSNAHDWPAAHLLEQASRELLENHLPLLVAARGEYLVKTIDISLVQGQLAYRLPDRCAAVRSVAYLQSDGTLSTLEEAIPPELSDNWVNVNRIARPERYVFREHSLELFPLPQNSADKIRVRYHLRPSRIVSTSDASVMTRAITAVTPNTPSPGLTTLGFATTAYTGPIDIIKSSSPFDIVGVGLTPSTQTTTTAVVPSISIPDVVVGDWIAQTNYTPFANVPVELHQPIALRAAAAVVGIKGDGLSGRLIDEAESKEKKLLVGILAPRSKGNVKRLVSRRWR